ncbi:MAG: reprolysin-like metallopeptidase [Bacteroidota bacterium]
MEIEIPLPGGGFETVRVRESSIMAPELQDRYPSVRTYLAEGDGLSGRLSVTPHGFAALLFDEVGAAVLIDPIGPLDAFDAEVYAVYDQGDVLISDDTIRHLRDDIVESPAGSFAEQHARMPPPIGEMLQTFRFAVATRGEYTAQRGGTVEAGLSAVVRSVNRVAAIFERDLAVSFQLVAQNDDIIFTDGATDPYDTSGGELLGQNQEVIDSRIGSQNYDIGHLLSTTDGGGLAVLRSACDSSIKAGSWSDVGSETTAFDLLVFPHELGHQLGAPHAWTLLSDGSVDGSGFEPGPGYTIMSYPHFATYRPPGERIGTHFHAGSIDLMANWVWTGSGRCGSVSATGNDVPIVNVPEVEIDMPAGAFFTLEGSATDESGTSLTYTWEQMDRYGDGSGAVPRFRVFDPGPATSRTFPDLERTLSGNPYPDEAFLDQTATYTFQLSARDNVIGGGAIGEATVRINADASEGLFQIAGGDRRVVYTPGSQAEVRWNVAGSDGGTVDAQLVDVMLSMDNGVTWTTVGERVSNDGSHPVTIPDTPTREGRFMVRPVGKRFFALSQVAFEIGPAPAVAVSLDAIDREVAPDATESLPLSISNTASPSSRLDYEVTLENVISPSGGVSRGTGYDITTSYQPQGPAVAFADVSSVGTSLGLSGQDDSAGIVDLPFPFPLYERPYSQVTVSTNGLLVFGRPASDDFTNAVIPSDAAPNGIIAPFWDDLSLTNTGEVYTHTLSDGRFVVQYNEVSRYQQSGPSSARYTFQVLLSPDGTIEFQYATMSGPLNSATVGVENETGTEGVEIVFNTSFVVSDIAIRLEPIRQWITVLDGEGQLSGGSSADVTVRLDASEIDNGTTLTADLVVRTNDGTQPVTQIPVTLSVNAPVSTVDDVGRDLAVSLVAPNPASSQALVRIDLAEPGSLRATLHDALGREVSVLYDGDATGSLTLAVDAASLAAGVYLVRVGAGESVETRQMVVVR